jgi:imidazole glycerol-phosphate synthase subunit HisH
VGFQSYTSSLEVDEHSMIAIVDYGMGNLRSVQKAFEKVGTEAVVSRDPDTINNAITWFCPGLALSRNA